MAAKPIILLDDGGVMNDNRLRGPQWQHLVGEFFAPRLGSTPEAWAEANRVLMIDMFEPANWRKRVQSVSDYASFERTYWCDWMGGMCRLVDVKTPAEEECIELAIQAETYITPRVHTAFPGAIEAIHELHTQGYTLHTASGESSLNLHGYLTGMGVRDHFGWLYGSDLLGTLKETPEYYERLVAHAGIAPGDVLIVDDTPRVLAWARELGAMTVLIGTEHETPRGTFGLKSLSALPELVSQIVG